MRTTRELLLALLMLAVAVLVRVNDGFLVSPHCHVSTSSRVQYDFGRTEAGGSLLALSTLADLVVNETDPGKRKRLLEALEELHSGQLAVKEEQLMSMRRETAAKEEQLMSMRRETAAKEREMSLRLDIARSKEREARREELKAKGLFHIRGFLAKCEDAVRDELGALGMGGGNRSVLWTNYVNTESISSRAFVERLEEADVFKYISQKYMKEKLSREEKVARFVGSTMERIVDNINLRHHHETQEGSKLLIMEDEGLPYKDCVVIKCLADEVYILDAEIVPSTLGARSSKVGRRKKQQG